MSKTGKHPVAKLEGKEIVCDKLRIESRSAPSARFARLQPVKFPLGDGTYQECTFIGVDSEGVATVKTKGGRYRTVWECNLYPAQRDGSNP